METIDFKNLDKKAKTEIVVTSVMVLAFVFILVNNLKTIAKKRKSVQPARISTAALQEIARRDASVPAAVGEIELGRKDEIEKLTKDVPWGRDPFSEKEAFLGGDIAVSDLKLEGILWHHGSQPNALINGEIVSKGDKIGNVEVLVIEKDTVIVTDGKKNYKLQLW